MIDSPLLEVLLLFIAAMLIVLAALLCLMLSELAHIRRLFNRSEDRADRRDRQELLEASERLRFK